MSALNPRKIIKEYVSWRRGGEAQLSDAKYRERIHGQTSVDQLRERARSGEDMNWTETATVATAFVIRHNNRKIVVPAFDSITQEPAPWITVDPGIWDLYMGNYDRMHSADIRERNDELTLLAGRNLHRFAYAEDADEERPFAFLEFSREEVLYTEAVVDQSMIAAGRLIEV